MFRSLLTAISKFCNSGLFEKSAKKWVFQKSGVCEHVAKDVFRLKAPKHHNKKGFKEILGFLVSKKAQNDKRIITENSSNPFKPCRIFLFCDRQPFGPNLFVLLRFVEMPSSLGFFSRAFGFSSKK